jgi:hypothetical protein
MVESANSSTTRHAAKIVSKKSERNTKLTSSSDIPEDWVDPVPEGSTSTPSRLWGGSEDSSALTCGAGEKKLLLLSSLRELHSFHETQAFVTDPLNMLDENYCPVGEWGRYSTLYWTGSHYAGTVDSRGACIDRCKAEFPYSNLAYMSLRSQSQIVDNNNIGWCYCQYHNGTDDRDITSEGLIGDPNLSYGSEGCLLSAVAYTCYDEMLDSDYDSILGVDSLHECSDSGKNPVTYPPQANIALKDILLSVDEDDDPDLGWAPNVLLDDLSVYGHTARVSVSDDNFTVYPRPTEICVPASVTKLSLWTIVHHGTGHESWDIGNYPRNDPFETPSFGIMTEEGCLAVPETKCTTNGPRAFF